MELVKASFAIEDEIDGWAILQRIERAGRTCYKSEERIGPGTAEKFVRMIIGRGHESVLEHEKVTVRIVCDRGVSHELVRHRLASYSQESTRYCNYGGRGISVIPPIPTWGAGELCSGVAEGVWRNAMAACESAYDILISMDLPPEIARSVLPNSLKTEIVMTCNLREWRHVFRLRAGPRAHPQMREIMVPLLAAFRQLIPVVFDDL